MICCFSLIARRTDRLKNENNWPVASLRLFLINDEHLAEIQNNINILPQSNTYPRLPHHLKREELINQERKYLMDRTVLLAPRNILLQLVRAMIFWKLQTIFQKNWTLVTSMSFKTKVNGRSEVNTFYHIWIQVFALNFMSFNTWRWQVGWWLITQQQNGKKIN